MTAPMLAPRAVSVAAFDEWVAGAAIGAMLIYAEGPAIPRGAPAWAHARLLCEDRVVTLASRRIGATGWQWIAQRTAAPVLPDPQILPVAFDEMDDVQRVLRQLRLAAKFDRVCPSNAEIAQACGLSDAAAASYRIRQLVAARLIRVEQNGPNQPRVVTILSSGKRTRAAGATMAVAT